MDLAEEMNHLREENAILKQALAEAGEFAHKRLPHDSREVNSTPEYFQKMFMDCAIETIKHSRSVENAEVG